jgi:Na+-transporting NADH:ubiquinone oxidoreductase subunit NqrC
MIAFTFTLPTICQTESNTLTPVQMRKVAEVIVELQAATDYIDELEIYNKQINGMLSNCQSTVKSYQKTEAFQKELSKKEKQKCNSIKVQRDIFGITTGAAVLMICILLLI